ncbi:hypothetical protein [Thermococcus sp. 21S7]|uniref:hypothetical protein n=1 Tax=Thermococcus sp. 21S7 TaxID=1638221 RepID=UPI00143A8502|nr:hypothetical protein [Thermococcus sp. 21S7]
MSLFTSHLKGAVIKLFPVEKRRRGSAFKLLKGLGVVEHRIYKLPEKSFYFADAMHQIREPDLLPALKGEAWRREKSRPFSPPKIWR